MTTPTVPAPIRYYSTNHRVPPVSLREALLCGQAADRGLFMPERIPTLASGELRALAERSYPEVAHAVLSRFTAGMLDDRRLQALCDEAYDFAVPLEQVHDRTFVLRLDRGPTASFKDFAARMMARWMGALLDQGEDRRDLVILTATSGDTGSAVAHAYHRVPRMHSVVLFPLAEVSTRQRKQMTTLGENVTTLGIDGKFDDCQAMVKRAFADPALARIRLSSANSINIGRLLPQAVYYIYAYTRLAGPGRAADSGPDAGGAGGGNSGQGDRPDDCAAEQGQAIVFSVPSGNFGDMMGAVLARRMGLPVRRIVIATNANDEVPRFLESGRYQKIVPSHVCLSNAMNVGHPSNLARLVDAYGGQMDETGAMTQSPDMAAMRRDFFAVAIGDDETRATIREAYQRHHLLLEPHGAVGWAGLGRYQAAHPEHAQHLSVSVETAHPAKFPDEIQALLGLDPELPLSLKGIEERPEHYDQATADYERFRELLWQRFAQDRP